ncbi:MAG: hypothetical protein HUK40_02415 [Desulfobacter sp.]|nr:hypothetical protein [Desulfobacter sp.]
MKPIKMNPLPESENQAAPKEAPMEGAHGATEVGASLGSQDSIPDPEVPEKNPGVDSLLLINCVFSKRLKIVPKSEGSARFFEEKAFIHQI